MKRLEYPLAEMQSKGNKLVPVVKAVGGVPGLLLQLTPGGGKSWIFRYSVTVGGKQKRKSMGLGSYPTYGVAEARDKAREAVRMLDDGMDPIKQQQAKRLSRKAEASKPTFGQSVQFWADANPHEFESEKYRQNWLNTVNNLKELQSVYVDQITDQLIWRSLEPVVKRSPDLGSRVLRRIATVLRWAAMERHVLGENQAETDWLQGRVKSALKGVKKQNRPSLQLGDVQRWWRALNAKAGVGSRALEFLAMTAVRSGDVRGMTWDEVDMEKAVWTIPAARLKIKSKGDHTVPLPTAAIEILQSLPRDGELVFPALRGGEMSDMTISKAMKDMHAKDLKEGEAGFFDKDSGKPAVPHGLRATFRTWAGEHGFSREHAEIALAHVFGDATERAYQRSTYTEQRRPMMEAWVNFLDGKAAGGGKVVEMRRG